MILEVRTSPIHGRGVFTKRDIPASRYIGVIGGLVSRVETDHTIRIDDTIIDPAPPFRFLNHSSDPNCELEDGVWVKSLRRIHEGEELTFHYGPDWG